MTTQIFASRKDFDNRSDRSVNGVTQEFLDIYGLTLQEAAKQNQTNFGCFCCQDCTNCKRSWYSRGCDSCTECHDSKNCTDCTDCIGAIGLNGAVGLDDCDTAAMCELLDSQDEGECILI